MADTYDAELFYRDGRAMARYPDGEEVLLADVMRYMNPGTEFDDATGSQMAATPPRADAPGFAVSPPEEDRFGATAAYMAEPYFADAGAIMSEAGRRPTYFTDPVLGNVERAGQYLGDAGMAGLNALGGAVYGGAGLLGDIFGGTPQQERRLARDIAGGTDVAGVGPELRIVDALRRGGPSLLDFATDAGKAAAPTARQFMRGDEGGFRLYQGSPHNFAAERLVRMPDGSTQYVVGAPDRLPDVPAGAELLQDFPLGRQRMDKIGTGTGAQALGMGLYGAEAESVGMKYRDQLSGGNTSAARRTLESAGGEIDKAILETEDKLRRLDDRAAAGDFGGDKERFDAQRQIQIDKINQLKSFKDTGSFESGSMYEMQINASKDDFLDSDLPLNKQPEAIRNALKPVVAGMKNVRMNEFDRKAILSGKATGGDLYNALKFSSGGSDPFSQASAATNVLNEAGIPGIKYLDAGSRGADAKSRNYVIFDENLINIVRKYGIAGAAAMLGMSQADVAQAMGQQPQGLLESGPQ